MRKVRTIDKGWNKIKRQLTSLDGSYTKVGIQSGEGTPGEASLAQIAAYNEFGTADIPARPFMRTSFLKKRPQLVQLQEQEYYKIIQMRTNTSMALGRIGAWYAGQVQDTLTNNYWTPNKPATIRAKGSSKPLIDTGELRAAITNVEVIK